MRKSEVAKQNARDYNKIYHRKNKDRLAVLKKEYHLKNRDHFLKLARIWRSKPESQYRLHISKFRDKSDLTYEEFISFLGKPCYYCGRIIEKVSLDRIDNSIGYTINNIVSCCKMCNVAKNKNTQKEFFDMCLSVVKKHELK